MCATSTWTGRSTSLMGIYLTNSAPEQFLLRQEDVWLEVRGTRGELHMNRLSHADFVARREGRRQ